MGTNRRTAGARGRRGRSLRAVLPRFIGDIAQIPPMYSALKRDGQKLCDLARQGIDDEGRAETDAGVCHRRAA